MSSNPLVIVGAGGHAKVLLSTLRAQGHFPEALFDDNRVLWGTTVLGVPVKGPIAALEKYQGLAVLGIGDNRVRKLLCGRLNLQWINVTHPWAYVDPSAIVGEGTVVFAGSVVQAEARIGAHSIVNTGSTIDHDCVLEDYVHIGPGTHLSGNVGVREGAFLGNGCAVRPGVTIGAWTTVGAGAVVIRDLPADSVCVGCPARPIRKKPASNEDAIVADEPFEERAT